MNTRTTAQKLALFFLLLITTPLYAYSVWDANYNTLTSGESVPPDSTSLSTWGAYTAADPATDPSFNSVFAQLYSTDPGQTFVDFTINLPAAFDQGELIQGFDLRDGSSTVDVELIAELATPQSLTTLSSASLGLTDLTHVTVVINRRADNQSIIMPFDVANDGDSDPEQVAAGYASVFTYNSMTGYQWIATSAINTAMTGLTIRAHNAQTSNPLHLDNLFISNNLDDQIINGDLVDTVLDVPRNTLVGGNVGSLLWKADFSSYDLGKDNIPQGNAVDDQFYSMDTSNMNTVVEAPDIDNYMSSDKILHTSSTVGATSQNPLIRAGLFDTPQPFGAGNGQDVMIMGFDVLIRTTTGNDTVVNHYYQLQPNASSTANYGTKGIPVDRLLRLTLVANHSTATNVTLPDFNGDGGIDPVTEILPPGKSIMFTQDLGGIYKQYGQVDNGVNAAGYWMKNQLNTNDGSGYHDIYYDNFFTTNHPGYTINNTPVLQLRPNLVPVDGGVDVINELDPNPGTYTVGNGSLPFTKTTLILESVPDRLAGLEGVIVEDHDSEYQFSVTAPARGFFLLNSGPFDLPVDADPFGQDQEWKLYREAAAETTFTNLTANIYYKDYEPGVVYSEKLWIIDPPDNVQKIRSASLGFRSRDLLDYRDISINRVVPAHYDNDPDDSENWVFRSGDSRLLDIDINNPSSAPVEAEITMQINGSTEELLLSTTTLSVGDNTIPADINALITDQGFYWCTFKVHVDGEVVVSSRWPIAYFDIPQKPARDEDGIPYYSFGAYEKTLNVMSWHPIKFRIYTHGIFYRLRQSGFNTVLATAYQNVPWHLEFIDIAKNTYGLQIVGRLGNLYNPSWSMPGDGKYYDLIYKSDDIHHFMIGDEPREDQLDDYENRYNLVRNTYPGLNLKLSTTLTGESVDDPQDPTDGVYPKPTEIERGQEYDDLQDRFVETNSPEIRTYRHYGINRDFNLVNYDTRRMDLPPEETFAVYERAYTTPWWLVPQASGKFQELTPDSGAGRLPTEKESEAYLHLALANGARGILAFTLHATPSVGSTLYALYNDELTERTRGYDSSFPTDAYATVGALVDVHGVLLASHTPATDFTVTSDNPEVTVRARNDDAQSDKYVYAVNLNAEYMQPVVDIDVSIPSDDIGSAADIYTGENIPVVLNTDGSYTLTASMFTAQGRMIQLVPDNDGDRVPYAQDNCPNTPNPGQEDLDGDGIGNACDQDIDGDDYSPPEDCDDFDANIHPGMLETSFDGIDQNCQGGDATITVNYAIYSTNPQGRATLDVEATVSGGESDPLTVENYGAMGWSNGQGGKWSLKAGDIGPNPGVIRITGSEGTIEASVTTQ